MKSGILALVWAAGCLQQAVGAETYRVAGVVVNSLSGSPMPGVRVLVLRKGTPGVSAAIPAGKDGRFSFDLPLGTFNLYVLHHEQSQIYSANRPESTLGISIITGPGLDTSNLVFRWLPPASISGRVIDESGEPVQSALVQLLRSSIRAGKRGTAQAGWTRTDDRGEYRFGSLLAGPYYLAVTAVPWYSSVDRQPDAIGFPTDTFPPIYSPNTLDSARAEPVTVRPGQEAQLDFRLTSVRGVDVKVTLTGTAIVSGVATLVTQGIGGSEAFVRQETIWSFAKTMLLLRDVPPGRYGLRFRGSGGGVDYGAFQLLDVNGQSLEVELAVRPSPVVSGSVQLPETTKTVPPSSTVTLWDETNSPLQSAPIRPDGTFTFASVIAKKCRVVMTSAGLFASEIQVDGADSRNGMVDMQDGQTLTIRIAASDQTGRLKGLTIRGGRPEAGVLLALVKEPVSTDRTRPHEFMTDSDGSFDFKNVPAGSYSLFPVEEGVEYLNPNELKRHLINAKKITIEPRGSYTEKIVLPEAPKSQ